MKLHSKFHMGKKVLIRLRSGEQVIARFKARKSNRYIFYDYQDIKPRDIQSICHAKPGSEVPS